MLSGDVTRTHTCISLQFNNETGAMFLPAMMIDGLYMVLPP